MAKKKISTKTIEALKSNKISGHALMLLEQEDLREVIPILGDRVLVKNILQSLTTVRNFVQFFISVEFNCQCLSVH